MKKYKCPNRLTYGIMWGFILICIVCIMIYNTTMLILHFDEVVLEPSIMIAFIVVNLILLSGLVFFPKSLQQYASTLTILENGIIWKCPLHKKIKLQFSECIYVGVEDSYANLKGAYSGILKQHGRGDEFCFIYLSSKPYPLKYKHKASSALCNKDFIKFAYSDVLCKKLIESLPHNKTGYLVSFYNSLQLADQKKAKEKKDKKRKEENQ